MVTEKYIIADFNSPDELRALCKENVEVGKLLSVYSPSEIPYLSEVSPLTVMEINASNGSAYNVMEENLRKQAMGLAAFLCHSIDNSLYRNVMNIGMARSKVEKIEKLCRCLGINPPFAEDDVSEDNVLSLVFKAKEYALERCKRFGEERGFSQYTTLEREENPEYSGFFAELFGDSLKAIIQYGSSVYSEKAKDVDLLLLVDKFDESIYTTIKDKAKGAPHKFGVLILPYDCLEGYVACDSSSKLIETKQGCRLIYGDAKLPSPTDEEVIYQMYINKGKDFTSLRDFLTNEEKLKRLIEDERFPDFINNTLKSELWIAKSLKQMEFQRVLSMPEFLELWPVIVTQFDERERSKRPSIDEVKDILYAANYRVKQMIEDYLKIGI